MKRKLDHIDKTYIGQALDMDTNIVSKTRLSV